VSHERKSRDRKACFYGIYRNKFSTTITLLFSFSRETAGLTDKMRAAVRMLPQLNASRKQLVAVMRLATAPIASHQLRANAAASDTFSSWRDSTLPLTEHY